MLLRRRQKIVGEFSNISADPSYLEIAPIGQLVVEEYLSGNVDAVYVAYTDFETMLQQSPTIRMLLPFRIEDTRDADSHYGSQVKPKFVYTYEPSQEEILNDIIPDFTALQIYQSVLSAMASEHAARMIAMQNATSSAKELASILELEYNKLRQANITNEMLDIAGGAEALTQTVR
jgi:F-type H+-transporting ATPase subunit gamma